MADISCPFLPKTDQDPDRDLDGQVLLCAGIEYLQDPVKVLSEVRFFLRRRRWLQLWLDVSVGHVPANIRFQSSDSLCFACGYWLISNGKLGYMELWCG